MHIALVSTYPPAQCGIANYSQKLANALRGQGAKVTVVAEKTGKTEPSGPEAETRRAWNRDEDWGSEILAQLESLRPDLVHIQHEEAILGQDRRLPRFLRGARALGIASAVTLHSVYGGVLGIPGIRYSGRRFQRAIGECAERVIVHQVDGCQDRLIEQGVPPHKVIVIPHGTELLKLAARRDARAALGIPEDCRLVLAIGFIHKKKGLHTLVQALPTVRARVPEVKLLVAGSFRTRPWDILYNRRLRSRMAPALRNGSIDLREDFHSGEMMNKMLAAADLLALPYRQRYGSASGILHMALGAGVPVLCADGYKFAEAKRAWGHQQPSLFPPPENAAAWASAMSEVLASPQHLARLAESSRSLGEETSWQRVAEQHMAGFADALDDRRSASA